MACPALHTGTDFVPSALSQADCLGRTIGVYGYGALANPGSQVALAINGLLAVFVALFGVSLMFGQRATLRNGVGVVVRIGIVLTLIGAWPAWRTLANDVVFDGPLGVTRPIAGALGIAAGPRALARELQAVDAALVAMTRLGSGRLVGAPNDGNGRDTFDGIALADQQGLAWGRVAFQLGALGPYAIVRLAGGILLALTPVMSALLLLPQASALFWGWARALAFVVLADITATLMSGIQAVSLGPWAREVVAMRTAGGYVPSMPTELLVLTLVFLIANFAMLALLARMAFQPAPFAIPAMQTWWQRYVDPPRELSVAEPWPVHGWEAPPVGRAKLIADSLTNDARRDGRANIAMQVNVPAGSSAHDPAIAASAAASANGIGPSARRHRTRSSAAHSRRDLQS